MSGKKEPMKGADDLAMIAGRAAGAYERFVAQAKAAVAAAAEALRSSANDRDDARRRDAAPPAAHPQQPTEEGERETTAVTVEIARLEEEAQAAAQAAYEAYNTGLGHPPAPNAGELLAAAAEAQKKLVAAKRS